MNQMQGSSSASRAVSKVVLFVLFLIAAAAFVLSIFGTIGTGNVGLRTTLGVISDNAVTPGVYAKWPLISTVQEFSAKDIGIDINDLTPKAKDNLSLRDLDLSIYYRVRAEAIPALQAKYAAQSTYSAAGYWLPAHELVTRIARNAAYEEVSKLDSLVIHTRRDELAVAIAAQMQSELDTTDRGNFTVSRVVIRQAATDPSIEQSIQQAVSNQKRLEAMQVQTEIAKKEAEIKITEAQGIARANQIINQSLTREYLQHEANLALMKFAEKGTSHTVVVPANMTVAPLIQTGK